MNIKLRQTLELEITTLNSHGQGQALFEGKIIDVDDVFPGDKVKASVTFISKEKIFAKAFAKGIIT
jgi:predicted RNA-binding protein with TRAM domain